MVSVEVTKVYYRAVRDGRSWSESSDLEEVKMMSEGYDDVTFEKLTRTTVTGDWQPLGVAEEDDLPDSIYDEGTYLNRFGQPVVVLIRYDQPADYSQVDGIVQGGREVKIRW